jgi:uncharacterized protein (TIGR03435 family)
MSGDLLRSGHLRLTGFPLKLLIAAAWQVKEYAIIGGPAWLESDHRDEVANAPQQSSPREIQLMLRALLTERFRLTVHESEKMMRAYALVLDRSAPKLKEPTTENSDPVGCTGGRDQGLAVRKCHNVSMTSFAEALPQMSPHYIDAPVINLTGLNGRYDFTLSWTPQQLQPKSGDPSAQGPTIFDAVESQLGLKLETRRLPVKTIVIDSIDRLQPAQ